MARTMTFNMRDESGVRGGVVRPLRSLRQVVPERASGGPQKYNNLLFYQILMGNPAARAVYRDRRYLNGHLCSPLVGQGFHGYFIGSKLRPDALATKPSSAEAD